MSKDLDITTLLGEAYDGREGAFDQVVDRVYADLRGMAEGYLRRKFGPAATKLTLEPAALVNESYLRLIRQRRRFANREQFFAIASRVMMRVLMDYHRARSRKKRGGDQVRVTLSGLAERPGSSGLEIPRFVESVEILDEMDARTANVLKLRLLWGLTVEEIAQTLGVSDSTVEREWRFAKRWLSVRLKNG